MHLIRLPRKTASVNSYALVPQTDTGGWVKFTKALGRFAVKELGKITL